MTSTKSALNVVMGAMTFGEAGQEHARVHNLDEVEKMLDVFRAHGHTEIDTTHIYYGGTSEEYLGKIDYNGRGLRMQTKLYPLTSLPDPISHKPEDLRKHLDISLQALKTDCLDMWYLHGPDRTIPYEVTLKSVDELYREGKFKRFGISNYASWEVAEIVGICRDNGYIQPTVYQGIYNTVQRRIEPELFPCLRKFGISFYAFSPLGGGFFTGRYTSTENQVEKGSRFDPTRVQGQAYRKRFWNDKYFETLRKIQDIASSHGLTMPEVALRWISHHSELKREFGDSVLIGASSLKHLEQNLVDLEKGPLPGEVCRALDEGWASVASIAANYWH